MFKRKKTTLKNFLTILFLSPLYICLLILFYQAFFNDKVTSEITILDYYPKEVSPGDSIFVKYKFDRKKSCEVFSQRILYNSQYNLSINIEDVSRRISELGISVLTISIKIPNNIPSGEYQYYNKLTYKCNTYQYLFDPYETVTPSINLTIK